MPLCVIARAPASPGELASAISGSEQKASASARASEAVATRSMSLQVSVHRLALPAISTCSANGCSRSASRSASAIWSAFDRSSFGFCRPSSPAASASRMLSSAFGPKPLSSRSRCSSAAFFSSSSEAISSSSKSLRARFGPSPGSRVISTRPGGYFALSFSAEGIEPVSSSVLSFSSIVLPMPGSSVTVPARVISATDAPASRIAFAALR